MTAASSTSGAVMAARSTRRERLGPPRSQQLPHHGCRRAQDRNNCPLTAADTAFEQRWVYRSCDHAALSAQLSRSCSTKRHPRTRHAVRPPRREAMSPPGRCGGESPPASPPTTQRPFSTTEIGVASAGWRTIPRSKRAAEAAWPDADPNRGIGCRRRRRTAHLVDVNDRRKNTRFAGRSASRRMR